jgi:hypothetical protein
LLLPEKRLVGWMSYFAAQCRFDSCAAHNRGAAELIRVERRWVMGENANISREELKKKIDRGDKFYLVEALDPEQYRDWHLPRAINIPYDKVRELAPRLLPDKTAEIVTYCGSSM